MLNKQFAVFGDIYLKVYNVCCKEVGDSMFPSSFLCTGLRKYL